MGLKFSKMHGIGNDYIYFNCFSQKVDNPEKLAVCLSDRHFGIGGDGIVLILPSDVADFKMRMFNADGSEGKMCGNATRCIGKYVYERGMTDKTLLTLETLSGIKKMTLNVNNGVVETVSVNMGRAEFDAKLIPVNANTATVIDRPVSIGNRQYHITCVSMGNPHCVTVCDEIDTMDIERIGRQFETSAMFPERVNTEFIEILGRNRVKMRVWERGSGETLACGTGACAVASAAIKLGKADYESDVTVSLVGGDLTIRCERDDTVIMTGPASFVFDGEICN